MQVWIEYTGTSILFEIEALGNTDCVGNVCAKTFCEMITKFSINVWQNAFQYSQSLFVSSNL